MSKRVYGIDLGTTYSCIAYVDEHGKPVVVPNSENQTTTPSVVYFETPTNVVVGLNAKENAAIHSDLVVSTIKRSMGDPNFEREIHGRGYKPAEIASFILRRLVDDAANLTGEKIEDVVITCPAYFGVAEKEATRQAGIIAGLNPIYIIPEPTAAAVAYGLEDTKPQNILVYDLGGGTFDITLISISAGEIAVVATGGDHLLGGKDWDEALVSYFAQAFEDATGTPAHELLEDMETYQELLNEAEKVKVRLSQAKSVTQKIRYKAGEAKVEVTHEKFDELTRNLLERTISMTKEMLDTGAVRGVTHIDKLLLVGGSTYMPQIIERVKEFPFEVVQFDPNMAVAKGAALFGYRCELIDKIKERIAQDTNQSVEEIDLSNVSAAEMQAAEKQVAAAAGLTLGGLTSLTNKKITNVSSKSFGLVVINQSDREVVKNLVVINDQVPRDITQRFGTHDDGQTEVELQVMQNQQSTGPDDEVELSLCVPDKPIGTAVLTFDRPLPAGSPIEVTFKLAPDGCLSLHGQDITTGREIQAEFKTEAVLSKAEVAQATSRALAMAVSGG